MARKQKSATQSFEEALQKSEADNPDRHYVLRLYVTGATMRSLQAIRNIREICETHLSGRYDLEIIDVYQQPVLAKGEQIIAAPTLIKKIPAPLRRLVGDLSDREKVLMGLDLRPG